MMEPLYFRPERFFKGVGLKVVGFGGFGIEVIVMFDVRTLFRKE